MKHMTFLIVIAALVAAIPTPANTRIKIDTVPSEYTPINSPTVREPVSLSSLHFEVNEETGRACVVAL